jgi:hypothetical protein
MRRWAASHRWEVVLLVILVITIVINTTLSPFYLGAFGLLAGATVQAEEPRAWLDRMAEAVETLNYEGTFVHVHQDGAETMYIIHRYMDGRVSERAKRSLAMQELLVEKGVIGPDEIRRRVEEQRGSPLNGANVVARAWVDSDFKQRLLTEARAAVAEMGFEFPDDTGLVVLENTEERHHLIVCTLCSCYPGALLGPPPDWYKSLPYRSRAVVDPRGVMSDFGLEIDQNREVRVMDSTAELRYMVLPRRPEGTGGLSEEELAELVPRDSLIGVAEAAKPETVRV